MFSIYNFALSTCLLSICFLLESVLVSPTKPYPLPHVPSFTILSSITPFSFLCFQYERLYSGGTGVELSHSDGGNINQVIHIGGTDAREEERSLFTRFRLIALSLFPRLFGGVCSFITLQRSLRRNTLLSSPLFLAIYLSIVLVLHFSCFLPASPVCFKHAFLISEIPSAFNHVFFSLLNNPLLLSPFSSSFTL